MIRYKKVPGNCCRFCIQTFFSVIIGAAVVLIFIALFSSFMTNFDCSDFAENCACVFSICIGCFSSGFILARHRRKKGIWLGIMCGLLIYAAAFLISAALLGWLEEIGSLGKFILIIICGAAGGVAGVNSKIRKPCRRR